MGTGTWGRHHACAGAAKRNLSVIQRRRRPSWLPGHWSRSQGGGAYSRLHSHWADRAIQANRERRSCTLESQQVQHTMQRNLQCVTRG